MTLRAKRRHGEKKWEREKEKDWVILKWKLKWATNPKKQFEVISLTTSEPNLFKVKIRNSKLIKDIAM